MANAEIVLLFSKIILTTIAAFFGIFLMAYTRDIGWIAIILGVVIQFVGLMFEMFRYFGILNPSDLLFGQFPVSDIVLQGLPSMCFAFGFITMLLRRRKR